MLPLVTSNKVTASYTSNGIDRKYCYTMNDTNTMMRTAKQLQVTKVTASYTSNGIDRKYCYTMNDTNYYDEDC